MRDLDGISNLINIKVHHVFSQLVEKTQADNTKFSDLQERVNSALGRANDNMKYLEEIEKYLNTLERGSI